MGQREDIIFSIKARKPDKVAMLIRKNKDGTFAYKVMTLSQTSRQYKWIKYTNNPSTDADNIKRLTQIYREAARKSYADFTVRKVK